MIKKTIKNPAKEIKELEQKLKQALADYHNLTARIEKRRNGWQEEASARIIDKLLDVYDDLVRARTHLKDRGLAMAVSQFWAILESEGVEEAETKGQEFDPEAMDCLEVVSGPKNKVVETIKKGYILKGKIIRPAEVKVGKGGK